MRSSCQVFLQHYKSLECYGVWMCLAWDIGFTDAASTRVAPTRSRPHRLLPKQLGPSIRKIRRSIEMRIEMDQSMRINQYGWSIRINEQWLSTRINKDQETNRIMVLVFACLFAQLFTHFLTCLFDCLFVLLLGVIDKLIGQITNFDCWLNWLLDWLWFFECVIYCLGAWGLSWHVWSWAHCNNLETHPANFLGHMAVLAKRQRTKTEPETSKKNWPKPEIIKILIRRGVFGRVLGASTDRGAFLRF